MMKEIIRLSLDNDMDLILAHKRAMKLADLCGLMMSAQTRFATAVSEIARCSISSGENSRLVLGIVSLSGGKKEISAVIYDKVNLSECNPEAFAYASRLARNIETRHNNGVYEVTLNLRIPYSGVISSSRIEYFIEYFSREAPLSPYDELRKKNMQLIELTEKLSDSESSYRQLTDALPLIVFSVSKNGAVTLANKNVKEMLGSSFNDFSITTLQRWFKSEDVGGISECWETARRKNIACSFQSRVKIGEEYLWHLVSIVPNKDEQGNISDWIVTMVNIHAQKLVEETLKDNKELRDAQESLKASNEELSQKNKELEQFAYIASHDLQEPLRKIMNFTSLAQRNLTEAEKEKLYFHKINNSAERMSRLIKDVLNYSRVSGAETAFEEVDLNYILSDVVSDFEFQVQEKNAEIIVDKLPAVNGVSVQLNQLFYNLIGNSLKFVTENPVVTIAYESISGDKTAKGRGLHRITVSDNGIGIESRHISKLFTIFRRLHAQNEYEGTGIGLALCKKIVENHGGSIEIQSTPNVGTSIIIYLPV
ncbi:ATP-binding protein [Flavobacterium sp. MFBS3-15]|uniref:sensor histidine kinase n=1 Tax=Flavobacterium sp. MFBS3-15 TaxID=2989816 RepID=UPI002236781D|nr:PAS domain-containing sensor histidine kinase [Flavobacterium sp. MFBS3-15]MCW4469405.1 ATP-binding protein [Flavobacterium sp. MFBS3-15]